MLIIDYLIYLGPIFGFICILVVSCSAAILIEIVSSEYKRKLMSKRGEPEPVRKRVSGYVGFIDDAAVGFGILIVICYTVNFVVFTLDRKEAKELEETRVVTSEFKASSKEGVSCNLSQKLYKSKESVYSGSVEVVSCKAPDGKDLKPATTKN